MRRLGRIPHGRPARRHAYHRTRTHQAAPTSRDPRTPARHRTRAENTHHLTTQLETHGTQHPDPIAHHHAHSRTDPLGDTRTTEPASSSRHPGAPVHLRTCGEDADRTSRDAVRDRRANWCQKDIAVPRTRPGRPRTRRARVCARANRACLRRRSISATIPRPDRPPRTARRQRWPAAGVLSPALPATAPGQVRHQPARTPF